MHYIGRSVGSAYIPKLLGTYERELHAVIQFINSQQWSLIIDIGAAEGYYAIGLALSHPATRVVAFEMDPEGRTALSEMCRLNGVTQQVEICGLCTIDKLAVALDDKRKTLVVCDVEGAERDLLDPRRVPALKNCHIIAELHEFIVPDIAVCLTERFQTTHRVEQIWQTGRSRKDYPFRSIGTRLLPKRYLDWAVSEWRPQQMSWLWMVPEA